MLTSKGSDAPNRLHFLGVPQANFETSGSLDASRVACVCSEFIVETCLLAIARSLIVAVRFFRVDAFVSLSFDHEAGDSDMVFASPHGRLKSRFGSYAAHVAEREVRQLRDPQICTLEEVLARLARCHETQWGTSSAVPQIEGVLQGINAWQFSRFPELIREVRGAYSRPSRRDDVEVAGGPCRSATFRLLTSCMPIYSSAARH